MMLFRRRAAVTRYLTKTSDQRSYFKSKHAKANNYQWQRISLPIETVLVSCSQLVDGVLEDLSTVDLFLQGTARDEAVDDDVHRLADTKSSVHCLWVGSWVPARINCSQSQRPTHTSDATHHYYHPVLLAQNHNDISPNKNARLLLCLFLTLAINPMQPVFR